MLNTGGFYVITNFFGQLKDCLISKYYIMLYKYTYIYIYICIYSRDTLHLMCWMLYQCVSNRTAAIDDAGDGVKAMAAMASDLVNP